MQFSVKQALMFMIVLLGLSSLACALENGFGEFSTVDPVRERQPWVAPSEFEKGSSGELCGNESGEGLLDVDADNYGECEDPEERCIHRPEKSRFGRLIESDCGKFAGRCVKPVRDEVLEEASDNPVCGCDGNTYGSAAEAWDAGVSIDERGACDQPSRADCGPNTGTCPIDDEVCIYPEHTECGTEGPGECRHLPKQCPYVTDPVCGCDGNTYRNKCKARDSGVSVQYEGQCGPDDDGSLRSPRAPSKGPETPVGDGETWEDRGRLLPDVPLPSSVSGIEVDVEAVESDDKR